MEQMHHDLTIQLPDGRNLGYAEFGDPQGAPTFFFHGIPGSRLQAQLVDPHAARAGIRIIGVDRPGIGLSTFQPGRTFLDWPADVSVLADRLELDRFAVVGISGGGAYVAACTHAMPDRVTVAGIISGMGPLEAPGSVGWMGEPIRGWRLLIELTRRLPGLMSRVIAWKMTRDYAADEDPGASLIASMAPVDRHVLERPGISDAIVRDFSEAVRNGSRGVAWELVMYARPWGFKLEDIPIDVFLWHGEADVDVPIAFGRYVADHIPRSHATYFPGEGHLASITHAEEILESLALVVR